MSKVVLSQEEVAQQIVEHLRQGLMTGAVSFNTKESEWLQAFVFLMNMHLQAK